MKEKFPKNFVTKKIGCLPFYQFKKPSKDQPGPLLETCPGCNMKMWTSKKKRERKEQRENVVLYCWLCIGANVKYQEIEHDLISLDEFN